MAGGQNELAHIRGNTKLVGDKIEAPDSHVGQRLHLLCINGIHSGPPDFPLESIGDNKVLCVVHCVSGKGPHQAGLVNNSNVVLNWTGLLQQVHQPPLVALVH